jgi:hypothetical protein
MSDTSADDRTLNSEFEVLAKRAGLVVPQTRKPALLKLFKELKRMTAHVRQPRTTADEPAGTYAIQTVTRSL